MQLLPQGGATARLAEHVGVDRPDLADVLGNFVNRIAKFNEARFDGLVPEGGEPGELEKKLYAEVGARLTELSAQLDAIEMRKAAQTLRSLWVLGNEYLQEAAPWTAIKTDPVCSRVTMRGQAIPARKTGYAEWQLVEE